MTVQPSLEPPADTGETVVEELLGVGPAVLDATGAVLETTENGFEEGANPA